MLFIRPLKFVVWFYIVGALGFFANVAQLINFNIVDLIKKYSPQSYFYLIAFSTLLYLIALIVELFKRNNNQSHEKNDTPTTRQSIQTGDVKNSTITQVGRDNNK